MKRVEYWVMRKEDIERLHGGIVLQVCDIPSISQDVGEDEARASLATFGKLNPQIVGSYAIAKLTLELVEEKT